jgi:uncharacterized protein (DUF2267 family)
MRHDEMIGKVQALAQLPDRGSAERATHAVLRTLGERLPAGLAGHLAAQLTPELAAPVRAATASAAADGRPSGIGERFGLPVFAGRIAGRAGTDEDAALREAAAVLEVLDAALAPELMTKVGEELPSDIRELLPSGRSTEDTGGAGDNGPG